MPGALKPFAPQNVQIKDVVRIVGIELNGHKPIYVELVRIPGVNWRFSHAICEVLGINKWRLLGSLSDEELEKLEDCLKNPEKYNIPQWMFNRPKDPEDGQTKHLVGADLKIRIQFDIKKEIELGSWKGDRHKHGLPVRGQKTRSHHRKGQTVGVQKKKK
ncbi:MAG: 30S ribosomal protein S13 [Nanopusillaceae archaeon]